MDMTQEKDFYLEHYGKLVGKKVTGIVKDPHSECRGLLFDDGTIAWIDQDAEGNGPGFLDISEPERKV
jgi:hypothetical protein